MTWLRVLWRRLSILRRGENPERDLDDEVDFHLCREIEENLRMGMNAAEARLAALRRFGGVVQIKDTYRETRGSPVAVVNETMVRRFWRGEDPVG